MSYDPGLLMLSSVLIALWAAAAIDWMRTDVADVRTLPKGGWAFTLLFLGPVGALGWFVLGRPWGNPRP